MDMIINVLNKKIKDMKDLRQREERRANKDKQDILDFQFKALTKQIHALMATLQYTKENMQFQLSDVLLLELENLLTEHKAAIRSGVAEKDAINQTEIDFKNIQQNIKKEWSKQYSVLTSSTISTLHVISGIDSERVTKCMEGITKGSVWSMNIDNFKTMNYNLSEAQNLIDGLGLDQQIITFLQNMNSGKATVVDLNDNVLRWLKEESLDKRVKLSFIGGSRRY